MLQRRGQHQFRLGPRPNGVVPAALPAPPATYDGFVYWTPSPDERPQQARRWNAPAKAGNTPKKQSREPVMVEAGGVPVRGLRTPQRQRQPQPQPRPRPRMGVGSRGSIQQPPLSTAPHVVRPPSAERIREEDEDGEEPIYCEISPAKDDGNRRHRQASQERRGASSGRSQPRVKEPLAPIEVPRRNVSAGSGRRGVSPERRTKRQAGDFSQARPDPGKGSGCKRDLLLQKRDQNVRKSLDLSAGEVAPIASVAARQQQTAYRQSAAAGLGRRAATQLDMRSGRGFRQYPPQTGGIRGSARNLHSDNESVLSHPMGLRGVVASNVKQVGVMLAVAPTILLSIHANE